jgi:hypothetical protein
MTLSKDDVILCAYVNHTSKLQIIRVTAFPIQQLERVVFPGQRLMFEALPDAQLEVLSGAVVEALVADRICCSRLRVTESDAAFNKTTSDSK